MSFNNTNTTFGPNQTKTGGRNQVSPFGRGDKTVKKIPNRKPVSSGNPGRSVNTPLNSKNVEISRGNQAVKEAFENRMNQMLDGKKPTSPSTPTNTTKLPSPTSPKVSSNPFDRDFGGALRNISKGAGIWGAVEAIREGNVIEAAKNLGGVIGGLPLRGISELVQRGSESIGYGIGELLSGPKPTTDINSPLGRQEVMDELLTNPDGLKLINDVLKPSTKPKEKTLPKPSGNPKSESTKSKPKETTKPKPKTELPGLDKKYDKAKDINTNNQDNQAPKSESTRRLPPLDLQPLQPPETNFTDDLKNRVNKPDDNTKLTPNPNTKTPGKPGGVDLTSPIRDIVIDLDKKITDVNKKLDDKFDNLKDNFDDIINKLKENQDKILLALTGLIPLINQLPNWDNIRKQIDDVKFDFDGRLKQLPQKITTPITNLMANNDGVILNHITNNTNQVISNQKSSFESISRQSAQNSITNVTTTTQTAQNLCLNNGACGPSGGNGCNDTSPSSAITINIPDFAKPYLYPTVDKGLKPVNPTKKQITLDSNIKKLNYLCQALERFDNMFPVNMLNGSSFSNNLILPKAKGSSKIHNFYQLFEYSIRMFDTRIGAPRAIKIKDANSLIPGDQSITLKPANLFELNNLIYKSAFDASGDIDLTNALATRSLLINANLMKVTAQNYGLLETLVSDLGVDTKDKIIDLNLPCDPYAGQMVRNGDIMTVNKTLLESTKESDIETIAGKMLIPSTIPVKITSKSDVATLRDTLGGISRFAAAAAAPNSINVDDIDKIIDMRKKRMKIESAIATLEQEKLLGLGPIELK